MCPFMAWSVQGLDGFPWLLHKQTPRWGCGCQWFVWEVTQQVSVSSQHCGLRDGGSIHSGMVSLGVTLSCPSQVEAHSWVLVAQHF